MRIEEMKQDILQDKSKWLVCYTFDDSGYYIGQSRRQPHPKKEKRDAGEFLMPRNSVSVAPVFKEGFRPRWNFEMQSWTLEPVVAKKPDVIPSVGDILSEKKQVLFNQLVTNLTETSYSELMRLFFEEKAKLLEERELLRKTLLSELKSVVKAELESQYAETVLKIRGELSAAQRALGSEYNRTQELVSYVVRLRDDMEFRDSRVSEKHAQVLMAASEVLAVKNDSVWNRVRDWFVSGTPDDESDDKDALSGPGGKD